MRKTKEQKGITLIALIITIVVLLILAVVAINAVTGDGIIQHATNAKTQYENAQAKEEGVLSYYSTYLEAQGDVGPWKQEGESITNTDTKKTIKLGDKVSYNQGSGYTSNGFTTDTTDTIGWRVLGVNKYGKLELISTNPTTQLIMLNGKEAYINAENILNNMCNELYGKGIGAESARSLNKDDIDKLAGVTTEEQKKALDSYYGREYYFKYIDGTVKISTDGKNYDIDTGLDKCYFPDETLSADNTKVKKMVDSLCDYPMAEKLRSNWKGDIDIVDFLVKGEQNSEIQFQWLAYRISTYNSSKKKVNFQLSIISGTSNVCANTTLFSTVELDSGSDGAGNMFIRPVVTLKSDAKLVYDEVNKVWNIN